MAGSWVPIRGQFGGNYITSQKFGNMCYNFEISDYSLTFFLVPQTERNLIAVPRWGTEVDVFRPSWSSWKRWSWRVNLAEWGLVWQTSSTDQLVLKTRHRKRSGVSPILPSSLVPYCKHAAPPPPPDPPGLRGQHCFCEAANCWGFKLSSSQINLDDRGDGAGCWWWSTQQPFWIE